MDSDYELLGLETTCSSQELEKQIRVIKNYYSIENPRQSNKGIQSLNRDAVQNAERAYRRIKNSRSTTMYIPSTDMWNSLFKLSTYASETKETSTGSKVK